MKSFISLILLVGVMSSVNGQGEWKLRKEKHGVRAFTRSHPEYSISEYKVESEVQGNISDIISIMTVESSYLRMKPSAAYNPAAVFRGPFHGSRLCAR